MGLFICRPITGPKPIIPARGRYTSLKYWPRAYIIGFGQFIGLQMDSPIMTIGMVIDGLPSYSNQIGIQIFSHLVGGETVLERSS